MKTQLFVIRNRETDKNVAIMLHCPELGRVLFKCRPSDSSLMKTFSVHNDKSVIVQVLEQMRGKKFLRRYRVIPTDLDYGRHLSDRFVFRPYEVRFVQVVDTHSLDSALDEYFRTLVDSTPTSAPTDNRLTISPSSIF
jgi:hypothetical protein